MTSPQRTKILVVDDLPEKLLVYEAILRDMNLELITATSGEGALRAVLEHEFAVILLDVNMPGMDGFETARMIRSRRKSSHTPIIFVTAYNDDFRIAEGYSRGAVDFITTPIIPHILKAKVGVFVDLFRMTQQVYDNAQQQISLTAERAQRTAAEEANRRLRFLVKAGGIITRSLDRRVIIDSVLRLLAPEMVDCAAIYLKDQEDSFTSIAERTGDILELSELCGEGELPDLWRDAITELTAPPSEDPLAEPPSAILEPRFAAFPLRDRRRIFGLLIASNSSDRAPFSDGDLQLLESIASRSAIALTNAKLYEELEFANQQKNRFLSMLAHELRNPLAPIQSAVDLMQLCRVEDENLRSAAEVIHRQVAHMVRLVDDLLDVSRITLGKIRLHKTQLDARDIVSSAIEISRPLILEQGHELHIDVPTEPVHLQGDCARLSQVLSNLLNNAAKYTPPSGSISLSLSVEGDCVLFRVRDSGVGIPSAMLGRIFDLFTQVDHPTDRTQGGLGIGLTLVRELVDMHGGRVEVHSPGVGLGSEFRVYLPLLAAASPLRNAPQIASELP